MHDLSLEDFPPASQNNARQIVKEAMQAFYRNKSDRTAQKLEGFGFAPDHSDRADHASEYDKER